MSKRGTGPTGDGLVMMKNAVVDAAPRAFAHRSHSGPFGVVNSEEGYRNLRRFLFGQVRIDARLAVDEITLPRAVQKEKDAGKQIRARYNIDACAKVRGGGSYLSERRVRNESAIRKRYEDLVEGKKSAYLFSGFLLQSAKTSTGDTALAFALEIAIEVPRAHSRFPGAVCRQRWTVRLGEVEPVFGQTGRVVLDITARTAHDGALKWTRAPSTP